MLPPYTTNLGLVELDKKQHFAPGLSKSGLLQASGHRR
jgi:hypothetical protein